MKTIIALIAMILIIGGCQVKCSVASSPSPVSEIKDKANG